VQTASSSCASQPRQVNLYMLTAFRFNDPEDGCRRSATFLPDVPPEQGWDVRDTLEALVRKAGYHVSGCLASKSDLFLLCS
jgi:hypothetical protein